MSDLNTWKASTTGWPVDGISNDTGGLGPGDYVIYSDDGTVKKNGETSIWGTITTDTSDRIEGTISTRTGWSFKITCPDGSLRGDLFETPVTTLLPESHHHQGSHHDHPHSHDDHDTDPTPGSWTAAEGGGHTFGGRGRRGRRPEV
jgi:hypothetical protein